MYSMLGVCAVFTGACSCVVWQMLEDVLLTPPLVYFRCGVLLINMFPACCHLLLADRMIVPLRLSDRACKLVVTTALGQLSFGGNCTMLVLLACALRLAVHLCCCTY